MQNSNTLRILLLLSLFFSGKVWPQYRVIGYLPVYSTQSAELGKVAFEKITHLNLAFINPDSMGYFTVSPRVDSIIKTAHARHVKVLASIGGGNAPIWWARLLTNVNRRSMVERMLALTDQYGFDGIDVDLEGRLIDENYEALLGELSRLLKVRNKLLTAAIATGYASQISDAALAHLDFVNIMSYDRTGPWTPDHPGPHAPYEMAVIDLQYWGKTRGIPKHKINLGLPFYGYQFGKEVISGLPYAEILAKFPGAEKNDSMVLNDGMVVYYNGKETIKRKTELAMQNAGGIMIWQLLQDAEGSQSLLTIINETLHSKKEKRKAGAEQ